MNRLFVYFKQEDPQTISPSAINTYLNCRLQFFLKYIARIEAPQELEEGVEANAVGSVVHKLMELLYDEWMNKNGNRITAEAIAWMQQEKETWIEQAFRLAWRRKEMKGDFQFSGELHIVRAIVLEFVDKLLQLDAAYAPFTLQQTEIKLAQPFGLQIEGRAQRVMLSGYVDRIDEKEGLYRMADYKTGGDNPVFQHYDALFERDGKKHNKAALQTLIYSWMFHKQFPEHSQFEPALLAVRHLQKNGGQIQLKCAEDNNEVTAGNINNVLGELEPRLRQLLEELFDPTVPFDQTSIADHCKYCDFAGICGR
jgi:CRISPR/Cas system-associated exonuclease Cas4 (RecB family)